MTHLMKDILKEPGELIRCLEFTTGEGRGALEEAAALIADMPHVYITGIGSSWHAGMAVASLFGRSGIQVTLLDASELLHFTTLPQDSLCLLLSRSGESIEIVKLLDKMEAASCRTIAVTNTPESTLARRADVVLHTSAAFDHLISITMYSVLCLVGGLLACEAAGRLGSELVEDLRRSLNECAERIPAWREAVEGNDWFSKDAPVYFLGRGTGQASAYETRLLWEEAAKAPASSYSTGGFRHGPQEIVEAGLRIGLWIPRETLRKEDLLLAGDLRRMGAKTLLIGQKLQPETADCVLSIPPIAGEWQFLTEIIPAQVCAEYISRVRGVDCDTFRACQYIVSAEGGLSSADDPPRQ